MHLLPASILLLEDFEKLDCPDIRLTCDQKVSMGSSKDFSDVVVSAHRRNLRRG